MSLRDFGPKQTTAIQNTSSDDLDEYDGSIADNQSIFFGMSRVKIPQGAKKGSVWVNRLAAKKDPISKEEWESVVISSQERLRGQVEDVIVVQERLEDGTYVEFEFIQFRVIPITSYTEWTKRLDDPTKSTKRGGLQMWKYDGDPKSSTYGKQLDISDGGGVVCRSDNGVVPRPEFVGTTQYRKEANVQFHPNFKKSIPIGEDGRGNRLNTATMCKECPFRSWADGKPACNDDYKFIGWAPAQIDKNGELMSPRLVVIGGPYSIQAAFQGQKKATKWGSIIKDLPQWDALIKQSGKSVKLIPFGDLQDDQLGLITGFAASDVKYDHMRGDDYVAVDYGSVTDVDTLRNWVEGYVASGELSAVTHVYLEEKKFTWAPEGLNGDIFPMEMVSVMNGAANPQRIPMLSAKEDNGQPIFEALRAKERADFYMGWQTAMHLRKLWEKQVEEQIAAINAKFAAPAGDDMESAPSAAADMNTDDLDE